MSFRIVDGTGFEITLDNGWTVSARFGLNNYCNNNASSNGRKGPLDSLGEGTPWESDNVEIKAFTNDKLYKFKTTGQDFKGWVGVDEFLVFVNVVKHWPDSKRRLPNSIAPCS